MSDIATKIPKEKIEALLGRSLSTAEAENYDLFLEIAVMRLDDLLCISIEEIDEIPADLLLLIARCFGLIALEQEQTGSLNVGTKRVEDFYVTYQDGDEQTDPMVAFVSQNSAIIEKYGACQGAIRSGKARHGDRLFPI